MGKRIAKFKPAAALMPDVTPTDICWDLRRATGRPSSGPLEEPQQAACPEASTYGRFR